MLGITRASVNEIQVNSSRTGTQNSPAAANFANGITLYIYGDPANNGDVDGDLFNASFVRTGSTVAITSSSLAAMRPHVAVLAPAPGQSDDRALVVWDSTPPGGGQR